MFELIHAYWWVFLLALLIGVATGWWAWAHHRISASASTDSVAGTVAAPAAVTTKSEADIAQGDKPKIAAAVGAPDDLLQIKGIGPKLDALCHSLGVSRFDQISKWKAHDIAEVDQYLGTFRGRIERDGWIEQAGYLASGNIAAFEAKFGKLDRENK